MIRLKYLSGMFFLFIIAISTSVSSEPNKESMLNEMQLLKQQYKLPSLSLSININNKLVFSDAVGYADINERKKATVDTQYSVGSLAKPMTGIALAKLVDLDKVSLDSLVSQYIKQPVYTDSFTVRELASHIAGIPHDTPERDEAEFVNIKDHKSPFDAFYVFSSHLLLSSPGTEYKYSSNGYILLSAIIEQAAKMNYVDFLKSSLWSKFGMESTELDTSFAGIQHEATYYSDYNTDGKYVQSTKNRDRSFLFGGGGFISTPTDLTNMAQAIYSDNYLSSQTRQAIYTPTKLRNGEVNSDKYSLGWRVGSIKLNDDDNHAWTVLHHGGVTDKASTAYLLVIPECKASIAFATNYIPNKFWRMRPKMAEILKSYINVAECKKANKSLKQDK